MGACGSAQKAPPAKPPSSVTESSTGLRFGRPANLRKEDYMVKHAEDRFVVRTPGSIDGQQFLIDSCVNCDVYLFDHVAAVTVDECTGCRFFVGPTASSLFVRDCKGCKVVAAVQQFRARDCSGCDIALFSLTPPIIESSSNLRFGCMRGTYFGMEAHMERAGLDAWTNAWHRVHDFSAPDARNWSPLPPDMCTMELLRPLPDDVAPSAAFDPDGWTVPRTAAASLPKEAQHESALAVLPPTSGTAPDGGARALAMRLLQRLQGDPAWWEASATSSPASLYLTRTKALALDSGQATELARAAGLQKQQQAALVKQAKLGACVALQVQGPGAVDALKAALSASGVETGRVILVDGKDAAADHLFGSWGESDLHAPIGVTM